MASILTVEITAVKMARRYHILYFYCSSIEGPPTQIRNSADTTRSRSFDSSKKEIVSKTCFSANAVTVALLRYSGFMMIKLSFITSNYVQSASRVIRLACTLAVCKMAPSSPDFSVVYAYVTSR